MRPKIYKYIYAIKTKLLIDLSRFEAGLQKAYQIVISVIHKEKTMIKIERRFYSSNRQLRFKYFLIRN